MSFERALRFTLSWEGGYVNHPNDPGGRTDQGISEAAHPEAWADDQISQDEVRRIYREKYWEPIRGDDLPEPFDCVLFDWAVHSGVPTAVTRLQYLVQAKPDGIMGPATLKAVARYAYRCAAVSLLTQRHDYLQDLVSRKPSQYKPFWKGWRRRLFDLRRYVWDAR